MILAASSRGLDQIYIACTPDCLEPGLTDHGNLPAPSAALLARVYGLSRAEALLAQGIAQGESLEEVAGRIGIKITTTRSQLASIFAKTGTRRQARLVVLLSRLAHLEE